MRWFLLALRGLTYVRRERDCIQSRADRPETNGTRWRLLLRHKKWEKNKKQENSSYFFIKEEGKWDGEGMCQCTVRPAVRSSRNAGEILRDNLDVHFSRSLLHSRLRKRIRYSPRRPTDRPTDRTLNETIVSTWPLPYSTLLPFFFPLKQLPK